MQICDISSQEVLNVQNTDLSGSQLEWYNFFFPRNNIAYLLSVFVKIPEETRALFGLNNILFLRMLDF